MPVRPLILSPPIVVRALRDDPADLLVRAGGGQRWRALRALPALRALFSMTRFRYEDSYCARLRSRLVNCELF